MKTPTKILFLIFAILAPFLAFEIFLRLTGYHLQFPYRDDADTGYSLQPNYEGPGPELYGIPRNIKLRVNGLGFRGREFPLKKEINVTRVLLLGDSCTFGLGIAEDETYAMLTEKMLNDQARANRRYEVINTAVPGYASYQGLETLREKGLPLKPDVLVAYFGWNDHWFSEKSIPDEEYYGRMHDFLIQRIEKRKNNPLRQTRTYAWLTDHLLRLQDSARHKNVKPKPANLVYRVPLDAYSKNLREMARLARTHQMPLILITAPHGFEKGKIPKEYLIENLMNRDDTLIALHESYVDETRKVARESGAILLDMAQFFMDTDRSKLMEPDGIHPNTAGHRIIAHELAKTISTIERSASAASGVPLSSHP